MEIKRISPDEAKELLDNDADAVYLDVRTVPEFDAGHVPGAKNIPVLDRDAYGRMAPVPRFAEIVEANFGRDVRCVTGCQKGARSMMAAGDPRRGGFHQRGRHARGLGRRDGYDRPHGLPRLGGTGPAGDSGKRTARPI